MKNYKGFFAGLVIGLSLAISSIGFAQTTTQNDAGKSKESCCAGMTSCCCSAGSCAMKHDADHKAKNHSGESGCCCCGADSCDTKMKENHEKQTNKQV